MTHDNDKRTENADLTFEGRMDGMDLVCSNGSYIGFCVTPDKTEYSLHYKVNISQAEAFAHSILHAIRARGDQP